YPKALESLERATRSYEVARLGVTASGLDRAVYGSESSPHAFLAAARCRAGQVAQAWAALEADLGRGLRDELVSRHGVGLTGDEQRQRENLRGQRTALEAHVLALVRRPSRTNAQAAELGRLIEERQQLERSFSQLALAVGRREVATLEQ